jgi:formate-dependent nitrite reductase membrane component NrfD
VILAATLLRAERQKVQRLGKFLVWLVVFELLLVLAEMLTLFNSHQEAIEAARLLLVGAYSPLFLGAYILLGLVLPLIILIIPRTGRSPLGEAIASILVLIGVFAMRYAIVLGGQYFPLS